MSKKTTTDATKILADIWHAAVGVSTTLGKRQDREKWLLSRVRQRMVRRDLPEPDPIGRCPIHHGSS